MTTTDYTADEVLAAFIAHEDDDLDDVWHEGPSKSRIKRDENGARVLKDNPRGNWDYAKEDTPFLLRGEPTEVEIVEQTGGADEGSHASITLRVGSQFFRKEGYYASHYGHDWDGRFYEVRSEVVSVTRFQEI
ncbi:MAG: hypothetical protein ACTIC1_05675 [Brevibacterium sp.]|uniref:hypothetical protein n=1 Tax=Brevibacterium aurantiacum TaxID=273384 RepID=UPI003F8FA985